MPLDAQHLAGRGRHLPGEVRIEALDGRGLERLGRSCRPTSSRSSVLSTEPLPRRGAGRRRRRSRGRAGRRSARSGGACQHPNPARPDRQASTPARRRRTTIRLVHELPGEYPYTRGIRADGYASRAWTMRQYAGFASAEETNERFRLLLERGQTGLSVGVRPADAARARLGRLRWPRGEVGRTGVAIDSLDDMLRLFDGIPLGERLDVDDDQRARRRCCSCSTSSPAPRAASRPATCAARCRTTCSRSTPRAATTSSRRGPRCG